MLLLNVIAAAVAIAALTTALVALWKGIRTMSAVTDATTKILAYLDQSKAGVTNLDAKIVALSAQLSGKLPPEDQAALDAVVAASAALATQANTDPLAPPAEPPPSPPPPPPPAS